MKENAYKKAGVDIEAGAEVVDRIKPHVKSTLRSGVMGDVGGFGAFFDPRQAGYDDPVLVSSTDGVGTKIKIAIATNNHATIGIDLVAMCVNDIVVQGAEPLFFLDYYASGKLEPAAVETVIAGIAEGCRQAGCALIGGETAEMPGLYAMGDYDLAGFSVGAVNRDRIIDGSRVAAGDVILGLASSGPHSNGYSLVRKLVEQVHSFDEKAPFDPARTIGEALLIPTRIYVRPLLAALKLCDEQGLPAIKAMAHITGGGLSENLPRVIPDGLSARIDAGSWMMPEVFRWLGALGDLTSDDMARTFNCGIGMAVLCAPEQAGPLIELLREQGETVSRIGHIEGGDSGPAVVIDNAAKAWDLGA